MGAEASAPMSARSAPEPAPRGPEPHNGVPRGAAPSRRRRLVGHVAAAPPPGTAAGLVLEGRRIARRRRRRRHAARRVERRSHAVRPAAQPPSRIPRASSAPSTRRSAPADAACHSTQRCCDGAGGAQAMRQRRAARGRAACRVGGYRASSAPRRSGGAHLARRCGALPPMSVGAPPMPPAAPTRPVPARRVGAASPIDPVAWCRRAAAARRRKQPAGAVRADRTGALRRGRPRPPVFRRRPRLLL